MMNPCERGSFGHAPKSVRETTNSAAIAKILISFFLLVACGNLHAQVLNLTQAGVIEGGYGAAPNLTKASSVFVQGNYAYVVGAGDVLEILDITLPGLPTHKGSLANGVGGASILQPNAVVASGNYAYILSAGGKAMEVVDVANPAHPVHKGVIYDGGGTAPYLDQARDLAVSGNYVYVVTTLGKLEVIDVSNPAAPAHKAVLSDQGFAGAKLAVPVSIVISGNYAYVASSASPALEIVDISNPSQPSHEGALMFDGVASAPHLQNLTSVYVSGNHAFLTDYFGGLHTVDVTDPAAPVYKAGVVDGGGVAPFMPSPLTVSVSGNYAYILSSITASHITVMEVLDVSNPAAPVHLTALQTLPEQSESMHISGNHAFVVCRKENSLHLVDISAPAQPTIISSVTSGSGGALIDSPQSVFVSGNYAYIGTYGNGNPSFEIVDVTNPAVPVHKGSLSNSQNTLIHGVSSVYVGGIYAFLAQYFNASLSIVEVSNPAGPVHTGYVGGLAGATSVSVEYYGGGTTAPIAIVTSATDNKLNMVNCFDITAPYIQSSVPDGGGIAPYLNNPQSVYTETGTLGALAFVASAGSDALEIINITNPAFPVHLGSLLDGGGVAPFLDNPKSVYVSGNYAYLVSTGSKALEIVDVTDPALPVHKGSLLDGGGNPPYLNTPTSVSVSGNYAFVTALIVTNSGAHGVIEVIDVSDPAAPVHYGSLIEGNKGALLDNPTSLFISGNYAYVTSAQIHNALDIVYLFGPSLTSFAPASGAVGSSVTVTGQNFNTFLTASINGVAAEITDVTATSLTFAVPPGASNGKITLDYAGQSFTTTNTFIVTPDASTASDEQQDSFVASWSNVGASSYFLDVSTDNFSTFVSGYDNLGVGNVTSLMITGLTPGLTYQYRVRSSDGISTSSNSSVATVLTIPSTPVTNAAAPVTQSGFTLSWSGATGASGYFLDVAADAGFTQFFTGLNNLSVSSTTQIITSAVPGTTYYYRVRSVNASGTSPFSTAASVETIPANPVATAPTAITITGFTASWEPVAGTTNYYLDVSTDNFSSLVLGYENLPTGTALATSVTGLSPGTNYQYRVRSSNASGSSGNSNTILSVTMPETPVTNAAASISQNSFSVSWQAVTGATSYSVDVASEDTFTDFILNNQAGPSTTQAVSGLQPGTTYYYRVRSTNISGTSASSAVGSALTIPADPPALPATSITTSGFTANWETAPGATEYRLDVSTDNFSTYVTGYAGVSVGTDLTQMLTGLPSGTTYQYRVRAANPSGTSDNSDVVSLITLPDAPLLQSATAISSNSFSVSWSAVVGATSYGVDVATDNGFLALVYNNVNVNSLTSYALASLSPNTTYYVRVRANTTASSSVNSNGISATTLSSQPTNQSSGIVFSDITDTSITLDFTPGNGASHLVLVNANATLTTTPSNGVAYAGDTDYGQGTELGSGFAVSNGAESITITGLSPAATYYFHVYDFNGSGGSEHYLTSTTFTNPLGRSTLAVAPTDQPTALLFTNASATSVNVSFNAAASGPSGYLVLRSSGAQPSAAPVNGSAYAVGATFGNATVVYAGPSVSFFDGGLPTSVTYYYHVYSFNGAGASTSYAALSPLKDNVTLDQSPPVISAAQIPNPATITAGNTPTFSTNIVDNVGVTSAKIFYRGISQRLYSDAPLTAGVGGNYSVQIQTTWYDSLGVEYYFWAEDQNGNEATSALTQLAQLVMSFSVPTLPSGTDESSYRIIAFPYKHPTDNKVTTVLSGPDWSDDTKAAMWWWDPSLSTAGEYRQYGKANGFETIDPGKGYWTIVAAPVSPSLQNVVAPKYNQSTLFPMTLKAGWNQIGNPYPVAISWDEVIEFNLANNPGADFGLLSTYNGTGYAKVSTLGPFKGGFVKNLGAEVTIQIPFPGQSGGRKAILGPDISRDDWNVFLHIEQNGRTNQLGGFGMHPQAKLGEDRFDSFNPPRFLEIPELNFTHPEKPKANFSNDMVNSSEEFVWQFVPAGTLGKTVRLTWAVAITTNTDNQVFLLDEERLNVIDMSTTSEYDFVMTASSRFRIFFGRDVQRKITTGRIVAGHPYPNPMTAEASATINVALPESGTAYSVNLQVFNAQGVLIGSLHRRLPPGIHPLEFAMSNYPATGIYIYKLAVSDDKTSEVYSGKIVKP